MFYVLIGYIFGVGMFKLDEFRGGFFYGVGIFVGDGIRMFIEIELVMVEY